MTEANAIGWTLDLVRLERARILRGWTRRDLARAAHVDEGTLSDLFRARRRPTFGTITAVCSSLELGLDEVILFEDDERPRD
jgi:transcriptional regulator with XRE-family HTH domain